MAIRLGGIANEGGRNEKSNIKIKHNMKKKLFLFTFFCFAFSFSNAQCGSERKKIKTLCDKDTSLINFSNPHKSSVHFLVNNPDDVPDYHEGPRLPIETAVFKVKCQLVNYKKEGNDGD